MIQKRQHELAATKRLSQSKIAVELKPDELGKWHHPDDRLKKAAKLRFHLFLSHVWDTGQDVMRTVKQLLKDMVPGICVFLDVDGAQ